MRPATPISSTQERFVESLRAASILDKRVELGFPDQVRAEFGPNISTYFREKHRRGVYGTFWPLHQIANRMSNSWDAA